MFHFLLIVIGIRDYYSFRMYFEVRIKRDNCITFSCTVIEKIQPFYFISVKYQIAKLCQIILILFTVTLFFLMFFHSLICKISRFLCYHVRFFQKVKMKIEESNAKDLAESESFIEKTVINNLYFIFKNSIVVTKWKMNTVLYLLFWRKTHPSF